ncbi:hypothetical protein EJB05_15017 [Eragrostis curvula]|uniref:Uncharacterized protein n=1 Tax=Eragrostis curvula TaxID=38414 RepID=A0A5J9W0M5_9POAL|nr:hypothetical protein EJB05_15017 [Eragrostis curvula]
MRDAMMQTMPRQKRYTEPLTDDKRVPASRDASPDRQTSPEGVHALRFSRAAPPRRRARTAARCGQAPGVLGFRLEDRERVALLRELYELDALPGHLEPRHVVPDPVDQHVAVAGGDKQWRDGRSTASSVGLSSPIGLAAGCSLSLCRQHYRHIFFFFFFEPTTGTSGCTTQASSPGHDISDAVRCSPLEIRTQIVTVLIFELKP